jgi:predicted TIM-barrel fold metal-dependent hydrolase
MYVAGRAGQVALKLGMDVSTLKDIFKSNLDAEILKNKNSKLGSGSSNLKQVYFDTVVFTPLQLDALVKSFGVDHIIGGTDYPFDMTEYDPIGHIASVESVDESARAALAGGNAMKLLGL